MKSICVIVACVFIAGCTCPMMGPAKETKTPATKETKAPVTKDTKTVTPAPAPAK